MEIQEYVNTFMKDSPLAKGKAASSAPASAISPEKLSQYAYLKDKLRAASASAAPSNDAPDTISFEEYSKGWDEAQAARKAQQNAPAIAPRLQPLAPSGDYSVDVAMPNELKKSSPADMSADEFETKAKKYASAAAEKGKLLRAEQIINDAVYGYNSEAEKLKKQRDEAVFYPLKNQLAPDNYADSQNAKDTVALSNAQKAVDEAYRVKDEAEKALDKADNFYVPRNRSTDELKKAYSSKASEYDDAKKNYDTALADYNEAVQQYDSLIAQYAGTDDHDTVESEKTIQKHTGTFSKYLPEPDLEQPSDTRSIKDGKIIIYPSGLTENEWKAYRFLLNSQGEDKARKFLADLETLIDKRTTESELNKVKKFREEYPVAGVALTTAQSILAAPVKAFMLPINAIEYLANGGKINEYSPNNFASNFSSFVNSENSKITEENIGTAASWIYQLSASMAENLVNMGFGAGSEAATLALMAAEVFADKTVEAKKQGLSDNEALGLAFINAFAEVITEKVSLDALFDGKGFAEGGKALKYWLSNVITEGSEEAASNVIDNFADLFIVGEDSEYYQNYLRHKKEGMTDGQAFAMSILDALGSAGLDALGGAITGGIFAAPNTARASVNGHSYTKTGKAVIKNTFDRTKSYNDNVQKFVKDARYTIDTIGTRQNSDALKIADDIQSKLDNGKEVTFLDLGKLQQAVYKEADVGKLKADEEANTAPDNAVSDENNSQSDLLTRAEAQFSQTGRASNSTVNEIIRNDEAIAEIKERTGIDINSFVTMSEKKNATNSALASMFNQSTAENDADSDDVDVNTPEYKAVADKVNSDEGNTVNTPDNITFEKNNPFASGVVTTGKQEFAYARASKEKTATGVTAALAGVSEKIKKLAECISGFTGAPILFASADNHYNASSDLNSRAITVYGGKDATARDLLAQEASNAAFENLSDGSENEDDKIANDLMHETGHVGLEVSPNDSKRTKNKKARLSDEFITAASRYYAYKNAGKDVKSFDELVDTVLNVYSKEFDNAGLYGKKRLAAARIEVCNRLFAESFGGVDNALKFLEGIQNESWFHTFTSNFFSWLDAVKTKIKYNLSSVSTADYYAFVSEARDAEIELNNMRNVYRKALKLLAKTKSKTANADNGGSENVRFAKKGVAKSRKNSYNEYNTIGMQWAYSDKTKIGDRKILYKPSMDGYVLVEATKDDIGFIELENGSYEELKEALSIYDTSRNEYDWYVESTRTRQDDNSWNSRISEHSEKDEGNGRFSDIGVRQGQQQTDRTADSRQISGNFERKSLKSAELDRYFSGADSEYGAENKISASMSDIEREKLLRNRTIEIEEYQGEADSLVTDYKKTLESKSKKLIQDVLLKIGEQFSIFGEYKNNDFDISVNLSKSTIRESTSKSIDNPVEIVKLMPKIEMAINNAVGLEVHDNRYYFDDNTINFAELLGGYIDGDYFVPVRFGVKLLKNGINNLYILISEDKIKKDRVVKPIPRKNSGHTDSRLSVISISRVLENVNSKDIIRYIPDGFLSDEKLAVKYQAIADTIKYTNDKNDRKYKQFIENGNLIDAERMVKTAAEKAGLTKKLYHQTENDFTIFDTRHKGAGTSDSETPFGIFLKPDSNNIGLKGNKQMALYANIRNPLEVTNRADLVNKLSRMSSDFADIRREERLMNEKYKQKFEDAKNELLKFLQENPGQNSEQKRAYIDNLRSLINERWAEDIAKISVRAKENITNALTDAGYDGVHLKQDAGSFGRSTETWIALESSQVKSADTITYDDNGDIIPLSQRFNPKNSDIRYSKNSPELDEAFSEADEEAPYHSKPQNTVEENRLKMAKKLYKNTVYADMTDEQRDAALEEIYNKTGCFMGDDRVWMIEEGWVSSGKLSFQEDIPIVPKEPEPKKPVVPIVPEGMKQGKNSSQRGVDKSSSNVYNESVNKNVKGNTDEGNPLRSDEFRGIQEESRRLSERELHENHRREQPDEGIRKRLARILESKLASGSSRYGYGNASLINPKTHSKVQIYTNVDGKTFHDVFEIVQKYLPKGDAVEVHDTKSYQNTKNYLTANGLAGFSITEDGDLISVFNLGESGFLKTIRDFIKSEGAITLDCYQSERQKLADIYSHTLGFKVASLMDFNYDLLVEEKGKEYADYFVETYGEAPVAFMVNTDSDVKTGHFGKNQYDEALEYRNHYALIEQYKSAAKSADKSANKKVKQNANDYIKHQLTLSKEYISAPQAVKTLVEKLLKITGGSYSDSFADNIVKKIVSFYDSVRKDSTAVDATGKTIVYNSRFPEFAQKIAEEITTNAYGEEVSVNKKQLRTILNTPIKISESLQNRLIEDAHSLGIPDGIQAHFGDDEISWKDFKDNLLKRLNVVSEKNENADTVSDLYQLLAEEFPSLFDPSIDDVGEQFWTIWNVKNELTDNKYFGRAPVYTDARTGEDFVNSREYADRQKIANEIIDAYRDIRIIPKTIADRLKADMQKSLRKSNEVRNAVKENQIKKIKESAAQMIENIRKNAEAEAKQKYDDKIAKMEEAQRKADAEKEQRRIDRGGDLTVEAVREMLDNKTFTDKMYELYDQLKQLKDDLKKASNTKTARAVNEKIDNLKAKMDKYARLHRQVLFEDASKYVRRIMPEFHNFGERIVIDKATGRATVHTSKFWNFGLRYSTKTMERIIEKMTNYSLEGRRFIEDYINPIHRNEAAATRFKIKMYDRIRELGLSTKKEKGNMVSESVMVQLRGEALAAVEVLEGLKAGTVTEQELGSEYERIRNGYTLEEWKEILAYQKRTNPNMDFAKIDNAVEEFRKIYDELIKSINDVRVSFGYAPIDYRQGYFPHFNDSLGDSKLAQAISRLGFSPVEQLPTAINGRTATFRPGIKYQSFAYQRNDQGHFELYDAKKSAAEKKVGAVYNPVYLQKGAVEGFESYINIAANVIYHTEDIQKLRAFSKAVRAETGSDNLKSQIADIRNDDNISDTDKENKIEDLMKTGEYKFNNFIVELEEYTNLLAGKKSFRDRSSEQFFGRSVYSTARFIQGQITKNTIVGNLGSAMTNWIPVAQLSSVVPQKYILWSVEDCAKMSHTPDNLQLESDAVRNAKRISISNASLKEQSDFLTNRFFADDKLVKTKLDKFNDILGKPMEFFDTTAAEVVVRARYYQNRMEKGMSHEGALHEADQFAARLMADRSLGAKPTIFAQNNPLIKLFTTYQIEVQNQLDFILKDVPHLYTVSPNGKPDKRKYAAALLRYMLLSALYNWIYKTFTGRDAALSPIDWVNDFVGDISGYHYPDLAEIINEWDADGEIWKTERKDLSTAGGNLAKNVLDNIPYVGSLAGNLVGLSSNRTPYDSAFPNVVNVGKAMFATKKDGSPADFKYKAMKISKEILKPIYLVAMPTAGGVVKKAAEGAHSIANGGSVSFDKEGNKQLDYPLYTDEGALSALTGAQFVLFGKTSTYNAQQWIEKDFKGLGLKSSNMYFTLLDSRFKQRDAYDLAWVLKDLKSGIDDMKGISKKHAFMLAVDGLSFPSGIDVNAVKDKIAKNYLDTNTSSVDLSVSPWHLASDLSSFGISSDETKGYYSELLDVYNDIKASKDYDNDPDTGNKSEFMAVLNSYPVSKFVKTRLLKIFYPDSKDKPLEKISASDAKLPWNKSSAPSTKSSPKKSSSGYSSGGYSSGGYSSGGGYYSGGY